MSEPVEMMVEVRCSQRHAFEVFTAKVDAWWPVGHRQFERSELTFEPHEGGRFLERASSGEIAVLGTVVHWEPPRRLVYLWFPGAIDEPTQVEMTCREQGDHAVVTIRHREGQSGLGDQWEPRARGFRRAWEHVLSAFARYSERRPDDESGP